MTNEYRFVLDTNLLVSAVLLKESVSRRAFDKADQEGLILVSLATIEELNNVLRRAKFNKYITEQERLRFLSVLLRKARLVEISETVHACRDPQDDKFLELAISGNADCLVSGDKDLLVLNPFRGIAILNPHHFLQVNWSASV